MAQMSNILVKDDAATPKEWTLVPVSDNPLPVWRGNDPAIPLAGQPRVTFSETLLKNGDYKITIKTEVPTMETLGASGSSSGYVAPPKVAYVNTAITTIFANSRSTAQDRANLVKMHLGICQGASATTATGTLANTTAGGGFLASPHPGPQLFISVRYP